MRASFRRLRTQSSPPTTHPGPRTPRARRKSRDGTGLTLRAAIPSTLQRSACLRPKEPPCTFFGKAPIPQTQERPPRAEEQSGGTPERRHRQEAQSAQGRMRWPDESGIWNGGRRKPQSSRAGRGAEGREIPKYCCGDLRKTGRTRSVTHERPCGRPAPSGTRRCGSRRGVSGLTLSPRPVSEGRPARPPAWVRRPRRLSRAPPVGVQDVAKPMSPSPPLSSLSRSRSWCPFMVRTWISWLSGLSRAGRPP